MGIAGSPVGVEDAAGLLERAGRGFSDAADSIASHGRAVTAQWVGSASDAASDAIAGLATRTRVGAEVVGGVGPVLRVYAAELRAAQGEYDHAAGAADHWGAAVQAADRDCDAAAGMPADGPQQSAARDAARAAAGAAAVHAAGQVAAAGHTMAAAVARAEQANQVAADAIDALTEHLAAMSGPAPASTRHSSTTAPDQPWQDAWNATAGEVSRAAGQFGDFAASVTGYYAEHPDQLGELVGSSLAMEAGMLVTAAGAGAEIGGIVLDATVIGAVIGVPANIAAAGVIATGATLTAAGAAGTVDDLTTMLAERDTTSSGGAAGDRPTVGTRISPQKQARHVLNGNGYDDGGYFEDASEAQEVLDAYHSGEATVVRTTKAGNIYVDYDKVTGYNNNPRFDYLDQPTHRFIIKGTKSVSVVPTSPRS